MYSMMNKQKTQNKKQKKHLKNYQMNLKNQQVLINKLISKYKINLMMKNQMMLTKNLKKQKKNLNNKVMKYLN